MLLFRCRPILLVQSKYAILYAVGPLHCCGLEALGWGHSDKIRNGKIGC